MMEQCALDLTDGEDAASASGPVTCLGMTFENDEVRRAHFTEKLRKKLQDPMFRKIEGFPLGSDEDILNLSDPPYYTACPNLWIADFIAEWEAEKLKILDCGLPIEDQIKNHQSKIPPTTANLSAISNRSIPIIAMTAHTIKGASANVGGERLRALAFEMEKAGKAGDLAGIKTRMDELAATFAELKQTMKGDTPCVS